MWLSGIDKLLDDGSGRDKTRRNEGGAAFLVSGFAFSNSAAGSTLDANLGRLQLFSIEDSELK